ncbi:uncharacterized protein LOC131873967 [Cryptomeria japonica]|uniref:uncharacterized protein LOC131873967 n=1 Tax=Cryptomeria japonica TaxID=3369 RepID=UPI0027DA65F0|nr:uncharacterized protein LOC131873967 [Cryptomeria japonica]
MLALNGSDLADFVERSSIELEVEEEKTSWRKKDFQAQRMLVDSVKDHIVPIISKLKTASEMFKTLEEMYKINNTSRALALKQQLHHIKMMKGESVIAYFMRISDLRDQLSSIGKVVDDSDLTMLALNGLPASWESYIQGISARPDLPKFDRLRADCIQEESRLIARGIERDHYDVDNQVLDLHMVKGKGRKWDRDRDSDAAPKKRKKDLSHIHIASTGDRNVCLDIQRFKLVTDCLQSH